MGRHGRGGVIASARRDGPVRFPVLAPRSDQRPSPPAERGGERLPYLKCMSTGLSELCVGWRGLQGRFHRPVGRDQLRCVELEHGASCQHGGPVVVPKGAGGRVHRFSRDPSYRVSHVLTARRLRHRVVDPAIVADGGRSVKGSYQLRRGSYDHDRPFARTFHAIRRARSGPHTKAARGAAARRQGQDDLGCHGASRSEPRDRGKTSASLPGGTLRGDDGAGDPRNRPPRTGSLPSIPDRRTPPQGKKLLPSIQLGDWQLSRIS